MSFTNKNEKSDEAFSVGRRTASSGSRRVMWKLSDEEETFDTIVVDYRCVPKKKLNATKPTAANLVDPEEATSPIEASASSASRPDAWAYIYSLIKSKQFSEELTQPNLALRYKPSKESLKYKRSKEQQLHQQQQQQQQQEQQTKEQHNTKQDTKMEITDLKVENCSLPPQQRAVVQEVPPKFAQCIPHNRNDSDSSDGNSALASMATKVIAANNSSKTKSSSSSRLRTTGGRLTTLVPSPNSSLDAVPLLRQGTQHMTTSQTQPRKRKVEVMKPSKSSGSVQKLASSSATVSQFRQRQIELHRYRIKVEQRRLDLLDLKIAREREDAVRQEILFQKDMDFKSSQIKQFIDDLSNV